MPISTPLTTQQIWDRLKTVMDPELNVDIVSLGLIYEVSVKEVQNPAGVEPFVHILMTLTTPGCPLAGVFDKLLKDALVELPELVNIDRQVMIELTFDPPWLPEMMSEEAKAELGLD